MSRIKSPTVEGWNAVHPVGTRVRYWPLRPTSSALPIETKTRSEAWNSNRPIVLVEGITGGVFLTHVDALPADEKVSEVTRLRAALAEIAALQTEEPTYDGYEHPSHHARRAGEYRAAEMARKGLGS